jgi:uncharacterized LabA/DUF88 family protein
MTYSPRTALFLDAGYFDKLCQDAFATVSGGKKVPLALDYKRLPDVLAGERPWRTYYYYCMPWVSEPPLPAEHAVFQGKQRFVDFLAGQKRWVMRQGVLERRGQKDFWYEQKRVDVMLAIDLMRLASLKEIQQAVLVAGDSDFVPLVEAVQAEGVPVRLRYCPGTAHADLMAACQSSLALSRTELEPVQLAGRPSS